MSAWLAHGTSSTGLLQTANNGQSKTVPAVASHRGRLWCLWEDFSGGMWYAATTADGEFGPREAFPQRGRPVIANLNAHLHVLVASETGEMTHFLFDEDDKNEWDNLGPLDTAAGVIAHTSPAMAPFHNKLFLVFLRDEQLYLVVWSMYDSTWSQPSLIAEDGQKFSGIPALFTLDGALHLLCATASSDREILGYRFDYDTHVWNRCNDVSEGKAASGVSATSYGDSAYLGFIENGPGDVTHGVYIATYSGGKWQPQEAVDGQSAADPPQIAILNGRIHCIFNDNSASKDLKWYSRPVLGYSLSSWMGKVPDDTPLWDMTIPGTHDSCARSNIPFVRTQYLSIAQQLRLGIRFFDLRLRRHDDGKLYCYHGGIPIDLPKYLSFEFVMHEIWTFLCPSASYRPTETVLVSINNDDQSPAQKQNPAVFYDAVTQAMAATPPYPDGRHRWYAEPVLPTLGEVRGRAVLLRRYLGDPAVDPTARQGLDLSGWLDDNPYFTLVTPTNVRVRLQDKWKYAERIKLRELVASKQAFVRKMMERAAPVPGGLSLQGLSLGDAVEGAKAALGSGGGEEEEEGDVRESAVSDLYINFCSAVGDPAEHGEIAEAKWIAVGAHSDFVGKWIPGMNRQTRDYLQQAGAAGGKRRLGVVNLDYPELPEDNDVVARLIETNF